MAPKSIIVACDGTWLDSDNGFKRDSWLPWKTGGRLAIPSNVTRFCRAILPQHEDGTSQITYYQAGLGSQNNWYSFFIGGYLGDGRTSGRHTPSSATTTSPATRSFWSASRAERLQRAASAV